MDPMISGIVNGLSEDARSCLAFVLGEAVNVTKNIDALCPYDRVECTSEGPLCPRLEMLLYALRTEGPDGLVIDPEQQKRGPGPPPPSDPPLAECGGAERR